MIFTGFKDLKLFDDNSTNDVCDIIFSEIISVFGELKGTMICGSVAKILAGELSLDYSPKDLDFVCQDYFVYRMLNNRLEQLFPTFSVRRDENRTILFTDVIAIEFWKPLQANPKIYFHKNIIPYTL